MSRFAETLHTFQRLGRFEKQHTPIFTLFVQKLSIQFAMITNISKPLPELGNEQENGFRGQGIKGQFSEKTINHRDAVT